MVGRKRFLLFFFYVCVLFCPLWGTKNTLSSAPSVKQGGERHIRGCLRGGPAVVRLGPLLFLPGWSEAPDPRRSWAGVLGASGRGSVVPSVSTLYDGKARGHWANMSSLVTGCSNPLHAVFFLTDLWEEENWRARGVESLSEKKANRERREARLKYSQCIQPRWAQRHLGSFPQAWHTLSVSVISVHGIPAHLTMTAWHLQQCCAEICSSSKAFLDLTR